MSSRNIRRAIERSIAKRGWYYNYADQVGHTIGLHSYNQPELIVVGISKELCYSLLSYTVKQVVSGLHLNTNSHMRLNTQLYYISAPPVYILWKDQLMQRCYLYYQDQEFQARQLYRGNELQLNKESMCYRI
jgi:hypothetical protein